MWYVLSEMRWGNRVLAAHDNVDRLLRAVCGNEEYPVYVSDDASLLDVCSLEPEELLSVVKAKLGLVLVESDLRRPVWEIADRLQPR